MTLTRRTFWLSSEASTSRDLRSLAASHPRRLAATAQGIPPDVVQQALKACGNDPDRAQVWIMLNHRTTAAGGAADEEQTAAEYQAAQDAYDDMVFERELQAAQLASEKVSAEESRSREAAFDASARAAPLLTFGESSAFLAAVSAVAPLSEAEASALRAPLSELLLLEHRARKAYDQQPARYFSRAGAQFADTQPPAREAFLLQRVDEVGNPSRPGSMYGMPLRGSGGLPDVFSGDAEGALVIDDDVVDLVDEE